MINASEHVHDDDPFRGHPDVRTRLLGVEYFFLGNGHIQAAVQWAPEGDGTPLGLLVMDPEQLRRKRESLTLDPVSGLRQTALRLFVGTRSDTARPDTLSVAYAEHEGVPAVIARWSWHGGEVVERFFCPDRVTPRLVRLVTVVRDPGAVASGDARLVTGGGPLPAIEVPLDPAEAVTVGLVYELDASRERVRVRCCDASIPVEADAARVHASLAQVQFGHELVDRLWSRSLAQMAAAVSAGGRVDASIWQYNREWVRDQSNVALGLLHTGNRDRTAQILGRLLRDFVTDDGSTIDSSEVRDKNEAELDQNGILLQALHHYVLWTGDLDFARRAWDRVVAVAEYPLRPDFATPQGLLANRREYWERHDIHGIEPGLELMYQVCVSMGLAGAAELAARLGHRREAARWEKAAQALRHATLADNGLGLVEGGALIKRRGLDGRVQQAITPRPDALLHPGVPLAGPGPHLLDPDTCTALPIALGFVPPDSRLAAETLDRLELLWNQDWPDGGYGRYHVASEADSPGGWPFASLFVARAAVDAGRPDTAWRVLRWLAGVPGAAAASWFEFYGPRIAPPAPQVGVVPWTWGELAMLLVQHVIGLRPDLSTNPTQLVVYPRLLPGIEHVTARFPLGAETLVLDLVRDRSRTRPWARVDADGRTTREVEAPAVAVPRGAGEVTIQFVLPRD